jgi:hypothetical protein
MDLQEQTRRDDNYEKINQIIEQLNTLDIFPSLVWVYTWDIVKDKIDYYSPGSGESYVINPKFTEKDIWDLFWEDAEKNGFTLEYGTEDLHEAVFDWMSEKDIIIIDEDTDDE